MLRHTIESGPASTGSLCEEAVTRRVETANPTAANETVNNAMESPFTPGNRPGSAEANHIHHKREDPLGYRPGQRGTRCLARPTHRSREDAATASGKDGQPGPQDSGAVRSSPFGKGGNVDGVGDPGNGDSLCAVRPLAPYRALWAGTSAQ